jgi:hypothetical protein
LLSKTHLLIVHFEEEEKEETQALVPLYDSMASRCLLTSARSLMVSASCFSVLGDGSAESDGRKGCGCVWIDERVV